MQNPLQIFGDEADTYAVGCFLQTYKLNEQVAQLTLSPAREISKPFSIDFGIEFMQAGMAAVSLALVNNYAEEKQVNAFYNNPGNKLSGFNGFGSGVKPIFTFATRSTAKILGNSVVSATPEFRDLGLKISRRSFSEQIRTAILCLSGFRIIGDEQTEPFLHFVRIRSLIL